MKGRLIQTLLMCLVCLTSSGYKIIQLKQKINQERQFKQELEYVLNTTESEMVVEATTNIVYAALAHDLQVTSKVYNASKRLLDLIITWTPPTSGRLPQSYNLHVLPLNETHPFCMTDPYYAYIDDPRAVSWKVPPDVIPGALHEGIQINTQCSYKVSLESNPHNGKSLVSTVYTVPECVEELCSCFHANLLPRPDVSASMISRDTLNVTWIIRPTKYTINVTKFVIGFGKVILRSSSQRHVYNMSWVAEARFISNQYFYSQLYILPSPGDYMVGVYSVDRRGCSGPVGNFTLTVTEPLDPTVGTFSKTEMFWMVILPSASFLLAMCVAICILGQRLISWMKKRNTHNDIGMTAIHHNHFKGTYKPISITSNRTSNTSFPSHQERNVLYVEKEIEDARAKGEADSYEIGYSRLTFGREIGKGAFGRVFLAEAEAIAGVPGVMTVAVKKLKNRVAADELEEFQAEIAMMKRVGRHANIVTMLGCCTLKQPFCMVMEYVPCGDLLQYLRRLRVEYSVRRRSRRDSEDTGTDTSYITPDTPRTTSMSLSSGRPSLSSNGWPCNKHTSVFSNFVPQLEYVLDPRELQSFATQIARGMAYLEGKHITHRDLAARNILIDEKKTLKISDFGLSRSGIYVNTRKKKVPLRWLSVEAMRDSLYSSKSDVWAFGIVLWEIGTLGGFPYPTVADYDLLNFLLQGRRLEQPENFSPEIYSLMMICWSHSADDRPTFADIVSYLDQKHRQQVYVDFSDLRPDHQFPPTEQMLKENKKV